MILIDTSVWSLGFRRSSKSLSKSEKACVFKLKECLKNGEAWLLPCIRQEILSGIRSKRDFEWLKHLFSVLPEVPHDKDLYEMAAELTNKVLAKGVTPSLVDMQLVAAAVMYAVPIFTIDRDFLDIQHHIDFEVTGVNP
ncbi:MAG: PIN domain-containing protein [Planctomycetes bacterium]|nr:PIN domain-containing protein [Planctomycetota bacterium]